ncbi:cryptochrome/photolyase family protein [Armatimonas sp.]|uniref:cryptochrome/photolyase family protein n=1 Tax=Armatimonas sp. TaxID=1872638 RepID=UPI00286B89EB|nr:cryptochrome/photolyase family protein [Armatimonas sp.]
MLLLLFPHQLFEAILTDPHVFKVILHEHPLYFTQFPFHPEKLALHRKSMAAFAQALEQARKSVEIRGEPLAKLAERLRTEGVTEIAYFELSDDWLERDVTKAFRGFEQEILPSPLFLTPTAERNAYFGGKKRVSMADFYKWQRRRLKLLVDDLGEPQGGRWSFDEDNRKPIPKSVQPPPRPRDYPVTHAQAREQLTSFLASCLHDFGPYEDAMRASDGRLFHSVLTPALNTGLLTPQEVVEATLTFAKEHPVPLASLEGFLRQVVGWREFVHGTYEVFGRKQRTTNFFGFSNALPEAFWKGETGLIPADTVIQRVNESGYCHHIERLMVLGCLLLLLEIHPDDVYGWFMTQFIDAYDWVMVPNVYGMSQYADGGLMTTKPYLCGSAYLRKMGDWQKGDWCADWDALYWRFIHRHRKLFLANHRSSMMVALFDKLKPETKAAHFARIQGLEQRLGVSLPIDPLT